jgi:predicted DNA-binding transcriptional regulator AlpA
VTPQIHPERSVINPASLAPLLLTEAQVADLLAISPRTLQMWRYKGGGPKYVKAGAAVRYRPADVDDWLASQARLSTSDPGPVAA